MKNIVPYIQRDISWLSFNYRVLQEAKDISVPLFERLKFLAIYSSNLDEFFKVRVASHRYLERAGKKTKKDLDFNPKEVLNQITQIVNEQQLEFSDIFENQIVPGLKENGIKIKRRLDLNDVQIQFVEDYFRDKLLPFVQPVLLVEKKVKPFLNNSALYLAVNLTDRDTSFVANQYAVVKIPSDYFPRFIELPQNRKGIREIIMLDDIVRHSVQYIFPGYDVIDTYSIKLTRDAELYIDDEFSGDLIDKVKSSLNKRNVGPTSRMVYDREMPETLLKYLTQVFELHSYDLLPEGRYHNNFDFFKFPNFGLDYLQNIPLPPLAIPEMEDADSIFTAIKEKDQFIHVPYHSYQSVVKFFEDAATDPQVTHIKIIQYRVAKESKIMAALMNAVKAGKQVSAFVEIKARFDEEANLVWGERLEKAGVNVHYSIPGLKVHCKLALVRRLENRGPVIYNYLSTGNFHEDTAKIYSDMGVFTADKRITSEATRVFAYLETKQLPSKPFVQLAVGKFNLKQKLKSLILEEIEKAKKNKPAAIILKMNSLQDEEMIKLLYEASQQGVKIKLIIRGICSLVPGVKDISENIEAISIVDRFLEHARIFIFGEGDNVNIYLSSADWMVRNLHHRIETMFPVLDPDIKSQIMTLMRIQLNDNMKSRSLDINKINDYKKDQSDFVVRSQLESYYYIKRLLEHARQKKIDIESLENE